MDPNVVFVPERQNIIPKEAAGKVLFDKLNSCDKNKVAVVEVKTGETYTYGNLIKDSVNAATNLQAIYGIDKNDVMAVISENSYKFWVATFAGLYLAAPLYLLNPGYTIYELKSFLVNSRPKVIFASKLSASKVAQMREDLNFVEVVVHFENDEGHDIVLYRDLIRNSRRDFKIETDVKIEDHVTIICNSSGTTGFPKGVMAVHETFWLNLVHIVGEELYPYRPEICAVFVVPPYHMYGFNITYGLLCQGAKVVIMDQFKPDPYLENIQRHKATHLFIVPALADFLVNSPKVDDYDLTSVQEVYSAAGVIYEELLPELKKKFSWANVRQAYGLTESASVICQTSDDYRPGSCGKVTSGHQVKVMDVESRRSLGPNERGEVCVRGAVMKGYLNDAAKTAETVDGDGFLHTGDIGYYDEDGHFYIVDRLKDVIKYKSFQVAPVEIEQILLQLPGVKDAAVVGKPDKRCGEIPVAFVVRREGARMMGAGEVADFVAERVCVEKRLHGGVRFVDEIPRGASGKILRKKLRDMV